MQTRRAICVLIRTEPASNARCVNWKRKQKIEIIIENQQWKKVNVILAPSFMISRTINEYAKYANQSYCWRKMRRRLNSISQFTPEISIKNCFCFFFFLLLFLVGKLRIEIFVSIVRRGSCYWNLCGLIGYICSKVLLQYRQGKKRQYIYLVK